MTLQAVFIPNGEGPGCGSIAAWCPWCERIHYHGSQRQGAAPRIESLAAHCDAEAASPFLDASYDLRVLGEMPDTSLLLPNASMPIGNGNGLHKRMKKREQDIRRPILAAILGQERANPEYEIKRLPDGSSLTVGRAGAWWQVTSEGDTITEGKGLAALASHLFGIPEEIAFIRMIEAATGLTFDSEAVEAFMQGFREWRAAGSPARRTT